MSDKELQELAQKYFQGNCTPEEEAYLHAWYDHITDDELVIETEYEDINDVKARLFSEVELKIREGSKRERITKLWRKKWMYAASLLLPLFIISGTYYYFSSESRTETHYTRLLKGDIGPGGNNAILELADGSSINLDSASVGHLASNSGIHVRKLADGMLSIELSNASEKDINQINTVHTPAGGQYQIKLADGSKVWLNAASTIKFPGIFSGDSREVELDGEAYFEVARFRNKRGNHIPFIVKNKEQRIEVLGTQFNVSSYDNAITSTTLIEGSVKVFASGSNSSELLLPGQQSNVNKGVIRVEPADIESTISWKNGDFIFNNEGLHSIMEKIERWYDVQVVYQNPATGLKFTGAVSRSKNLSDILQIMELTGKVKFEIKDRRVLVME